MYRATCCLSPLRSETCLIACNMTQVWGQRDKKKKEMSYPTEISGEFWLDRLPKLDFGQVLEHLFLNGQKSCWTFSDNSRSRLTLELALPTGAPDTKAGTSLAQMKECQHIESPNHFLEQTILGCLHKVSSSIDPISFMSS